MNRFRSNSVCVAAALISTVNVDAAPLDQPSVSITPHVGYKVKLTGSFESVVYTVTEGEEPDMRVVKELAEAQCETLRRLGGTSSTPQFEAGWDARLKTKTVIILAKHMKYEMFEKHSYDNLPDDANGKTEACAGTYRVRLHRSVLVRKFLPDRAVDIEFNLQRKKGTRFEGRLGTAYDFRAAYGLAANRFVVKAGEISGVDEVLGFPCSLIKKQFEEDNRVTEICVAVPDDERVPKLVQGRVLKHSSTWTPRGSATRNSWGKATEIVSNGLIDTGVFEVPEGIDVKESRDPKLVLAK